MKDLNEYGKFGDKLSGYTIEKLPDAGNYEYIYKNEEILVKVDQYGIVTVQIDPPVGEAVFKREEREVGSPVKALISDGERVFDNFGVLTADKLMITFLPEKSTYLAYTDDYSILEKTYPYYDNEKKAV